MPEDDPRVPQARFARLSQCEALDALGLQMNLTQRVPREAIQQFGQNVFV
jgi:hypothetical protein